MVRLLLNQARSYVFLAKVLKKNKLEYKHYIKLANKSLNLYKSKLLTRTMKIAA